MDEQLRKLERDAALGDPQAQARLERYIERTFYVKDFDMLGMANTLSPDDIGTHDDGWTIEGRIWEDYYEWFYYEWVNDFTATHPVYGRVWGNFEDRVYATNQAAYDHFVEHHPPSEWDYQDI